MAELYGDDSYLIDELGTLSFGEVERRTNALASSLAGAGVEPGEVVALMAATTVASSRHCSPARSWARSACC